MRYREKDWADECAMRMIPMTGDPQTYRTMIGQVAAEFRRVRRKAVRAGYKLGRKDGAMQLRIAAGEVLSDAKVAELLEGEP